MHFVNNSSSHLNVGVSAMPCVPVFLRVCHDPTLFTVFGNFEDGAVKI